MSGGSFDQVIVRWADGQTVVGTAASSNNRVGFIEESSLTSELQAIDYGQRWLAANGQSLDTSIVETRPALDAGPWGGVGLGDAVDVQQRDGGLETVRVVGRGINGFSRAGVPNWSLAVGAAGSQRQLRQVRELARLGAGSGGGSFPAASSAAPSWGTVESGKLPQWFFPVADTDELSTAEGLAKTNPYPVERQCSVIRLVCQAESLVGSTSSKFHINRVAYNAAGTIVYVDDVYELVWPGNKYRYTAVVDIPFEVGQGYQIETTQAGAHALLTIRALASSAN